MCLCRLRHAFVCFSQINVLILNMIQNVTADGIRADKTGLRARARTHAETIPTTYRICTLNHHFSRGGGGGVFTGLQRRAGGRNKKLHDTERRTSKQKVEKLSDVIQPCENRAMSPSGGWTAQLLRARRQTTEVRITDHLSPSYKRRFTTNQLSWL